MWRNVAGLQAGLAPNPVTHRNRVDLSGGYLPRADLFQVLLNLVQNAIDASPRIWKWC